MQRNLAGLVAIFAAAFGLVGLTFSASTELPADLRFINGTEPKTLDPQIMTGQPEGRIADAIFEGLTYRDPASLRPVPGAAESWELSEDQTRYTFHIRKDAVWSDGHPVTAHDFAWSWRHLQEPTTASEYAYILHMVKWAEIYNVYEGAADALEKDVLPALDALGTAGLDGDAWQTFVGEHHVSENLKGTEDPLLQEVLSQRDGTLDGARLAAVRAAVAAEARRRRELYAHAKEHFGVDEGVFATDDHTLVVELTAPTAYFLDITCFYPAYPVPRWVVEERQHDWFLPGNIVSNGPFRLESWKVNDRIRLVKSDTYWDKDSVRLGVVDAYSIENLTTCLNLYLTGGVDWTPSSYPSDLVNVLRQRPDFYVCAAMTVYYYRFNTTRKPFDDPRVRKAICLAVDRESITRDILAIGQIPAGLFCPPGLTGYQQPDTPIGPHANVAEAKRLLAEAGFPEGQGFPKFAIISNTHESHRRIAEFVADQLKRNLGIEVEAVNQEWQAYQDSTRFLRYDMARAAWIGDYMDPNTFLDMWVTNGGNNQTGWGDPTYDRLIQGAANIERFIADPDALVAAMKEPERARELLAAVRAAPDQATRVEAGARLRMHLFREAEAILVQDACPVMPIYFYVNSGLVSPRVKGFHVELEQPDGSRSANLQDIHPLRGMWIEGPAEAPR